MRSTTMSPSTRRSAIARLSAAMAVVTLLTGCMLFSHAPQDLDYSRTRLSEAGIYRGTIRPQGDSIPQGRLQRWTLHLETAGGAAVDSATILVDGGMPQHGHGLPTKPRSEERRVGKECRAGSVTAQCRIARENDKQDMEM